jgi:hypothetical protein
MTVSLREGDEGTCALWTLRATTQADAILAPEALSRNSWKVDLLMLRV